MSFANIVSFLSLLVVNYLAAATTKIGGQRTGDVVKDVKTYADPAPFAFSIWSVIYLLVGFDVFFGAQNPCVEAFFPFFCAFNMLWLVLWGNKRWTPATILIFCYAFILYRMASCPDAMIGHMIHFGWVMCASTVSIPLYFQAVFGFLVPDFVVSALLFLPTYVSLHFPIATRVTVIWALFAIAMQHRKRRKNEKEFYSSIVVVACAIASITLLASVAVKII